MNQIRAKRIDTMLDLASYPTTHRIERVCLTSNQAVLDWSDGQQSRFHAVWLRDNCPCPACRHPQALEREAEARLASGAMGIMDDLQQQFERTLIARALAHTGGRRIEASHLLGLGRNTLTRKIQELRIEDAQKEE